MMQENQRNGAWHLTTAKICRSVLVDQNLAESGNLAMYGLYLVVRMLLSYTNSAITTFSMTTRPRHYAMIVTVVLCTSRFLLVDSCLPN